MENEDFYEDQFIVYLTIDGTNIQDAKVEFTDIERSIQGQVEALINHYNLPKVDNGSNPIQYWLGVETDGQVELEILEFTDDEGREMTLYDYDVNPGSHLHLISIPIAG